MAQYESIRNKDSKTGFSQYESHKLTCERGNQRLVVRVGVGEGDIPYARVPVKEIG